MQKEYKQAVAEVILFDNSDVIRTSGDGFEENSCPGNSPNRGSGGNHHKCPGNSGNNGQSKL